MVVLCPWSGGKERKRLYEEGMTAGTDTATTAAYMMAGERGTLSATRVYYYYFCFCWEQG